MRLKAHVRAVFECRETPRIASFPVPVHPSCTLRMDDRHMAVRVRSGGIPERPTRRRAVTSPSSWQTERPHIAAEPSRFGARDVCAEEGSDAEARVWVSPAAKPEGLRSGEKRCTQPPGSVGACRAVGTPGGSCTFRRAIWTSPDCAARRSRRWVRGLFVLRAFPS
jgi:hypothetical protein